MNAPRSVRHDLGDHRTVLAQLRDVLPERRRQGLALDGYRPAAVALLLCDRGGYTHVPFTVRSSELSNHSGQISLPGGVRDAGDDSFADTARRETLEELGVAPARLDVLGLLDDVPTPTGFVITPVVAELLPGQAFVPNPDEVATVFEAPLALFADPAAREELGEREFRGILYRVHAYRYEGHRIWGATARIVGELIDLLAGSQ